MRGQRINLIPRQPPLRSASGGGRNKQLLSRRVARSGHHAGGSGSETTFGRSARSTKTNGHGGVGRCLPYIYVSQVAELFGGPPPSPTYRLAAKGNGAAGNRTKSWLCHLFASTHSRTHSLTQSGSCALRLPPTSVSKTLPPNLLSAEAVYMIHIYILYNILRSMYSIYIHTVYKYAVGHKYSTYLQPSHPPVQTGEL